jgi:hypothetical protein
MMLNCDRLWTELVTRVYRLRGLPRITNDPPPLDRPTANTTRLSSPD